MSGAEAKRFENMFTENMHYRVFEVKSTRAEEKGHQSTNVEYLRNSNRAKRGRGGNRPSRPRMRGGFNSPVGQWGLPDPY